MSIFGRIFAGEETIKTVVNAARDGLDALVYTDEEKAGDAAKDRAAARGMVVEWMKSTSGQNLARRWLSVAITSVWLGQYVVAQIFTISTLWIYPVERRVAWRATAELMASYAEQMNSAVMLILAFYFAAPHMGAIVDAAMSRFGKPMPRIKDENQ